MNNLPHKLQQARPRIDAISPIVGKGILGFSLFNMSLGIALFTLKASVQPEFALINYLYDYKVWGVLFFCLGASKLYAYIRNDWGTMKRTILFALGFKSMWLFALVARFIMGEHDNFIILILWALVTHLQALTYIYFLPKGQRGVGDGR